eukprot:EG_transcript_20829
MHSHRASACSRRTCGANSPAMGATPRGSLRKPAEDLPRQSSATGPWGFFHGSRSEDVRCCVMAKALGSLQNTSADCQPRSRNRPRSTSLSPAVARQRSISTGESAAPLQQWGSSSSLQHHLGSSSDLRRPTTPSACSFSWGSFSSRVPPGGSPALHASATSSLPLSSLPSIMDTMDSLDQTTASLLSSSGRLAPWGRAYSSPSPTGDSYLDYFAARGARRPEPRDVLSPPFSPLCPPPQKLSAGVASPTQRPPAGHRRSVATHRPPSPAVTPRRAAPRTQSLT